MSSVQPPGKFAGLGVNPCGAKTPGWGQVRASFGREASIENGAFLKWLANALPVVVSVHLADSGGEVRLTSFWSKHLYGTPPWLTWMVLARDASRRPLTPSHPP